MDKNSIIIYNSTDGKASVSLYALDMILAIGFRMRSKRGHAVPYLGQPAETLQATSLPILLFWDLPLKKYGFLPGNFRGETLIWQLVGEGAVDLY